jgi:glycine C-acetyltransferase
MFDKASTIFSGELDAIKKAGNYKSERTLGSPQGTSVSVDGRTLLSFCANNYLGLSNHPELINAAKSALDRWGYGLSSVRFICGTQELHKELEHAISNFLGMDDAALFGSCFDANGGIFEALLDESDAIISDELNHASIIDGVRLSKARRLRYAHGDLSSLELELSKTTDARITLIVTDGVFSMDGDYAPLEGICGLAKLYGALVMVDDSHATGFIGSTGRGTSECFGVTQDVDIITSTFGKALGGASGGFVAARHDVVNLLRQRSRPYLFSNTIPPPVAAASLKAIELVRQSTELSDRLMANTARFRLAMVSAGFSIVSGDHPIVPIMLGDAAIASKFADLLFGEGIYAVAFSFPVVPTGKARIRVQISALHTSAEIDRAIEAFISVGRKLSLIS